MIEVGTLVALGLAWAAILFGVALYGDRHPGLFDRWGALVQGLSLAVYCTSWTFYGMVTQAASHGWLVPPTFLGTMALLVFGFPFLLRLCRYAREQNATSIADLVGARFDQDLRLAALVTGVALLGLVPYIALQLRAVAEAYERLVAPVGAHQLEGPAVDAAVAQQRRQAEFQRAPARFLGEALGQRAADELFARAADLVHPAVAGGQQHALAVQRQQ